MPKPIAPHGNGLPTEPLGDTVRDDRDIIAGDMFKRIMPDTDPGTPVTGYVVNTREFTYRLPDDVHPLVLLEMEESVKRFAAFITDVYMVSPVNVWVKITHHVGVGRTFTVTVRVYDHVPPVNDPASRFRFMPIECANTDEHYAAYAEEFGHDHGDHDRDHGDDHIGTVDPTDPAN